MNTKTTAQVHPVAIAYRDVILQMERAIVNMTEDLDSHPREIARCLLRALNTGDIIRSVNRREVKARHLVANRMMIHDVLGAPGDWGYGTPLGDALQQLYRLDLTPLLEAEDERPEK